MFNKKKAIFSSNLVYIPFSTADNSVVIFLVRKAIRVYVVFSLFLTGLTIMASYFWGRHLFKPVRVH